MQRRYSRHGHLAPVLAVDHAHPDHHGHSAAVLADHATSGTTGQALAAAGSAGDPWITTLPGSYTGDQAGSVISTISKVLRNKSVTDSVTGRMTVYDDDGVTPLLVANLYQDAAGTTPYAGKGAERRERLE